MSFFKKKREKKDSLVDLKYSFVQTKKKLVTKVVIDPRKKTSLSLVRINKFEINVDGIDN